MKLIATYAEGFMACFTESRTGMKQRALIDVGDKAPTPQELAELAGILCDQWGWESRLERAPAQVKKKELTTVPKVKRTRDDSDVPLAQRKILALEYLATHSNVKLAEMVEALGFVADRKRVGRWFLAMNQLRQTGQVTGTRIREGQTNQMIYSLPEGKP